LYCSIVVDWYDTIRVLHIYIFGIPK
ncbi:hypothetical protein V496_10267, partial [Pseudogymnoascus sp. VKM F-4515 (FW-2607)]